MDINDPLYGMTAMRLHPLVSKEEALNWLRRQVEQTHGPEELTDLEDSLQAMAEAMAMVSSTVLPDDLEPYFP